MFSNIAIALTALALPFGGIVKCTPAPVTTAKVVSTQIERVQGNLMTGKCITTTSRTVVNSTQICSYALGCTRAGKPENVQVTVTRYNTGDYTIWYRIGRC